MAEISKGLEKIKAYIRRRKLIGLIKYSIYAIIIVGVVLHLINVYNATQVLEAKPTRIPSIERMGFLAYRVTLYLDITNPTATTIEAKNIFYQLYVEGRFVGQGYLPYLTIKPGSNPLQLSTELNLRDLPSIAESAVAKGGEVEIKVDGYATIPLKAFGVIPWQEVTIPLSLLPPYKVKIPISEEEKRVALLYGV